VSFEKELIILTERKGTKFRVRKRSIIYYSKDSGDSDTEIFCGEQSCYLLVKETPEEIDILMGKKIEV